MGRALAPEELTILVVDDDDDMRGVVCRMLRRMKIETVLEAANAQQALARLETYGELNLVICDWNMAGMSGLELFKQVRASRPNLPFLLLTGRADPASVLAAKNAGVQGYLAKPISPQQLQAKVTSIVNGATPQG